MSWFSDAWEWVTGGDIAVPGETKALPASVGPTGRSLLAQVSQSGRPPRRGTAALLQVYSTNPRVQAAVNRIATSVATIPLTAYRVQGKKTRARMANEFRAISPLERKTVFKLLAEQGEIKEIPSHPVLDMLNNPNPVFTASEVRETMQMHLELTGESFTITERRGALPAELWPIPPHWAKELPSVRDPNYTFNGPNWGPRKVPPEDVLWIRQIDPLDPYGRGVSLTQSLANELDADEYAAQMTAARFFNHCTPDMLVMLRGPNETETARYKEKWRQENAGVKRAGNIFFTNAEDMKTQQMSPSVVDMDLVNLREFEASVIRETFGIPPEILGHLNNSNRATIDAAELIMAVFVLVPRLKKLEDAFNTRLVPQFADDIVLCFDSPVPDDWEFKLKAALAQPAAMSMDEWRLLQGLEPHANKKTGKKHFVPFGVSLTDIDEEKAEPEEDPYVISYVDDGEEEGKPADQIEAPKDEPGKDEADKEAEEAAA